MDGKYKLSNIQFGISSISYTLVFIAVCVSVSFSQNALMLINGIFFIIYILSLWKTGMDTYEFYDSKYFVVDMLSVAVYANIPYLFMHTLSDKNFVSRCLLLLIINEMICVVWDFLCHDNSSSDQGKGFHFKWTIRTVIGIIIMIFAIMVINLSNIGNMYLYLLVIDSFSFLYQLVLLIIWWYSEYKIEHSNLP